jgi:lipoprotein-anchoring transpeptidase ErfK/SrfK
MQAIGAKWADSAAMGAKSQADTGPGLDGFTFKSAFGHSIFTNESRTVNAVLIRLTALAALLGLAACAEAPQTEAPPEAPVPAHYQAVQDDEFLIPAVEPLHLFGSNSRTEVDYAGSEEPGTIVVDTHARVLYHVKEGGKATRYGIAVGREGLSFRGTGYVGRKQEWPSWQPTANMIRTRPDLYAAYAAGLPGGLDNPLGARALYLYRGGNDTMFRIHGTIDNASIGRATSAGCIRLFNQDAIHLFENAKIGDRIVVRTLEQSLSAEGPYMDDAYGRAVPDTPESRLQFEADQLAIAEAERKRIEDEQAAAEAAAEQAAKDERRRLRICRNRGIDEAECPTLEELTANRATS